MTSGVPDFENHDYFQLDKAVGAAPSKHWTIDQALSHRTTKVAAPNSPFSYSNPSYLLLGMLIEKVTGRPFATVLPQDLATPAGLQHGAFQDGEKPQAPAVVDDNDSCGEPDGYLPCRAFASALSAAGGLAADAPTLARWGYQLYGRRVLPAAVVGEMTKGDGEYGLGTMRLGDAPGIGAAFRHVVGRPDHISMIAVIPEKKVSVALLFADGGRNISDGMTQLAAALQPLLN